MIAITQSGHKIYLYQTNLGHAGEFLNEILRDRDPSQPTPIIMSDALSSNLPSLNISVVIALCNVHARRQFVSSHFYKTQVGADVANVLTSVIVTAYRNDGNPFEYLNQLQRNNAATKAYPVAWMPWERLPDTT